MKKIIPILLILILALVLTPLCALADEEKADPFEGLLSDTINHDYAEDIYHANNVYSKNGNFLLHSDNNGNDKGWKIEAAGNRKITITPQNGERIRAVTFAASRSCSGGGVCARSACCLLRFWSRVPDGSRSVLYMQCFSVSHPYPPYRSAVCLRSAKVYHKSAHAATFLRPQRHLCHTDRILFLHADIKL